MPKLSIDIDPADVTDYRDAFSAGWSPSMTTTQSDYVNEKAASILQEWVLNFKRRKAVQIALATVTPPKIKAD